MICYRRPPKPNDFDDTCRNARTSVTAAIAARQETIEFDNVWGNYKEAFSVVQSGKCGYCEIFVIAGQDGDVEHYRPKGQAYSKIKSRGHEVDNGTRVEGRRFEDGTKPAYWWCAYEWKNYLLSCLKCNRRWKIDYFPVQGSRATAHGESEKALLLNPFSRRDPVSHLDFDDIGAITAHDNSQYGQATIDTCGLDRPSLTRARVQQARRAHQLARELLAASEGSSDRDYATAILDVYEAGRPEYQFAGVVRAVIKHNCNVTWGEIENMAAQLEGT